MCLLRNKKEIPFAFTRHTRVAWSVVLCVSLNGFIEKYNSLILTLTPFQLTQTTTITIKSAYCFL